MSADTLKINQRVQTLLASSTLAITARAKELKAQGKDVVNFAGGEPDFDTPEPIKQAAIQAIQNGFTKYTPSIGTLQLREAIAHKFKTDNHLDYQPSQIAVSCGAKHSLFNIIQVLADKGDEVLIPAPYWVSYPEMVKLSGATPTFLPTTKKTNFKITPEQLLSSITGKTKILILNSPANPTGVLYGKKDLEDIADVCVQKGLFIISDEIYEKLIFDADDYVSIASLGKEVFERTITVNGVSKAYSMTGWRIGYSAGAQSIMDYVKKVQDHSTSNPTSISQAAALAALQLSPESVVAMRNEFRKRRNIIMAGVDKIPEIRYTKPGGAFYLFCNISKLGSSSFDVAQRILNDVNVAFIPGEGFGAPGFARLSFATSDERIHEGIRRIAGWIKKNKS